MLEAELDKLDGLPEAIAKEYTKVDVTDADGKTKTVYRLSVKDSASGFTLMNPSGLMQTIQTLRQHEARNGKYGTITPEEALANAKKVNEQAAEIETLRKSKGGSLDERVTAAVAERDKAHAAELATVNGKAEMRWREIQRARRYDAARAAAQEAGFKEAEVLDLIAPQIANMLEVAEDEKATREEDRYRTVVRDERGNVREVFEKDKNGATHARPMTAVDLAKSWAGERFKRFVTVETKNKDDKTPTRTRVDGRDHLPDAAPTKSGETFNPVAELAQAWGA